MSMDEREYAEIKRRASEVQSVIDQFSLLSEGYKAAVVYELSNPGNRGPRDITIGQLADAIETLGR